MIKTNNTLKGIIIGVIVCGVLTFFTLGAIAVINNYYVPPFYFRHGSLDYIFLFVVLLTSLLLGIGIWKKSTKLKKVKISIGISLAI